MDLRSKCIYLCISTVLFTLIATSYIFIGRNQAISIGKNTTEGAERPLPIFLFRDSERNKSDIQESQLRPGNVPNFIIQYGPPRTATTLQITILCLCMAMLHEDENNSVGCYDNERKYKYSVMKTHDITAKFLTTVPSNSWIFMTSSAAFQRTKGFTISKQKIKEHNITIPYVADVSLVSKRGHFIAYKYQSIFGLSDKKMQHIIEYLRYWDILRLCCGMQMSEDWRNHLSPRPNYKRHHDPHSSTYSACETYNISKVEVDLLNTYVFKRFVSLRNFIGKPSRVDGNLTGNYCESCNANIAKRHLKFNDRCA